MNNLFVTLFVFWGTLATTPSIAETAPTVRFWEGAKNEDVSDEVHRRFIAETLAPGTVVAGFGALDHYVVYLPPRGPLPEQAFYHTLPFSEAAIPIYRTQLAYDEARAAHPEYGPLHFVPSGFKTEVSYSATPVRFVPPASVDIASPHHRVAYDLRASDHTGSTGASVQLPNWQGGTTLVWLMLRRSGTSQSGYQAAVSSLFSELEGGITGIDGHYARVSEGHVLHFMNVKEKDMIDQVKEHLLTLVDRDDYNVLINFDLVEAKSLEPFAAGWGDAFTFGSAVNVQFPVKL